MSSRIQFGSLSTYLATALIAGVLVYHFLPQVQERIKVQEKEVVKKQVVTVVKEVVRPDGSRETNTTITDNSTGSRTSSLDLVKLKKSWHASVGTEWSFDKEPQSYSLGVQYRVLGPFFIGGSVSTDKRAGLSLGWEF